MPLTDTAKKVLADFKKRYGDEKGERWFYATMNKNPKLKKKWEKSTQREAMIENLVDAMLDEARRLRQEMTTSGDIGTFPGGFKVKPEDLPDEEETARTGIGFTGIPAATDRKLKTK